MNKIYLEPEAAERLVLQTAPFWNLAECAKMLNCSLSALYKLTAAGKLKHYKPTGKLIYVSRPEMEKWVLSNPVLPIDEVEEYAATYVANNPLKAAA